MPLSCQTACCALWQPSHDTIQQRYVFCQAPAPFLECVLARNQITAQPFSGCEVCKDGVCVLVTCTETQSLQTWRNDHTTLSAPFLPLLLLPCGFLRSKFLPEDAKYSTVFSLLLVPLDDWMAVSCRKHQKFQFYQFSTPHS